MSLRSSLLASISTLALATLLLGAAACGKTKDKPAGGAAAGTGAGTAAAAPSGPADPRSAAIIVKSQELRDRACACADDMCASAVRRDHDTWLRGQIDEMAKLGEPASTPAQQEEASKLQRELFTCLEKAAAATAPPAPPVPSPTTPPAATP